MAHRRRRLALTAKQLGVVFDPSKAVERSAPILRQIERPSFAPKLGAVQKLATQTPWHSAVVTLTA